MYSSLLFKLFQFFLVEMDILPFSLRDSWRIALLLRLCMWAAVLNMFLLFWKIKSCILKTCTLVLFHITFSVFYGILNSTFSLFFNYKIKFYSINIPHASELSTENVEIESRVTK